MKLYIAGPMAGLPQFNFPAFEAAAAKLRAMGHEVVSPAEEDEAQGFIDGTDLAASTVTADARYGYMRRDIPIVLSVDGIVLLSGWVNSQGAVIETIVARAIGLKIFQFFEGQLLDVDYISDPGYSALTQTLRKVV